MLLVPSPDVRTHSCTRHVGNLQQSTINYCQINWVTSTILNPISHHPCSLFPSHARPFCGLITHHKVNQAPNKSVSNKITEIQPTSGAGCSTWTNEDHRGRHGTKTTGSEGNWIPHRSLVASSAVVDLSGVN